METWWQLRCWICGWCDARHFTSYDEAKLATPTRHRCGEEALIFPKEYHEQPARAPEPTLSVQCIQCGRVAIGTPASLGIHQPNADPWQHTSALCPPCANRYDQTHSKTAWLLAWHGKRPQGEPMTDTELANAIAEIHKNCNQGWISHEQEDTLYRHFLQWMAQDAPEPWRGRAAILLTTQSVDFPRWYD